MKKFFAFAIIVILITLIVVPFTYSYGTELKEKIQNQTSTTKKEEKTNVTNEFLEIENSQITLDDKIQAIVDIDKIEYDKFTIEISTDSNISNVKIEDKEKLKVEEKANQISIEIDKTSNTLKQITLNYELPTDSKAGDKITILAVVSNSEDEEESQTAKKEIEIIEASEEKAEENIQEDKSVDTKKDENKSSEVNAKENSNKKETQPNSSQVDDKEQTSSKQGTKTSSLMPSGGSSQSSSLKSSESTVTYNGSDNNYLSSLSVEGYSLNKDYSKENETYFLTVQNDVQSLNINAGAEESTAKVCIYGNEDLQSESNKILISVTAENGNVRTYRIYVTKAN